ncbi:MAG: DUF1080 domain-containing protein [Prolixibacteraceae bacterium]|jgi:hypothetical protein|nr:DUF1080 domain-containing protein [Prolixibacteraceae bacterium]MBT6005793.1 DUF1080 domain-containing protein [Prolixibacteraceae bacterium]MBT6765020.1 DUF1080 domain-containing protein [Prolixibacteraceae bacterium]MBT6998754.1 DUF1080 domain-containing protein [Prolixibacteraceae bacterium]MBT7393414.1 DUF1080 domain-containing protein [Prolixibacteraceae bacterium]
MKILISFVVLVLTVGVVSAQEPLFKFGEEIGLEKVKDGKKVKGESIQWIQVNTEAETWKNNGDVLICSGLPIGVIRSEKKYENFLMHIEWRHMEAGGNSGTFVWSDAEPGENRLPNGVEVQMLELDWVNINTRDGKKPPIAYVHGEVFGVGGVELVADNPRGKRSKSVENRCKGKGEWNTYDVVCVDGTIKLSVNGKFVNGISKSSKKSGFICLESEGAEIQFRNIRVIELP